MLVFETQMHVLTFIVICLETGMILFYQLPHYLSRTEDVSRLWYLILLVILIFYNVTGGLLPDPSYSIPVILQNIIAYGSGFLMAAYFPFFFYKGLGLERLRKHALVYAPLCILLPYLVFFCLIYSLNGDLEFARTYGMVIPFIYSVVVSCAILNAIRLRFAEEEAEGLTVTKTEAVMLYCAVSPWVLMTVFSFFQATQWLEVLMTNLGFLLVTVVFMSNSVKHDKQDFERLKKLDRRAPNEEVFEKNIASGGFSAREIEVVRLLRQGYTKEEIGELLFIEKSTVSRHTQNIYYKAGVNNRLELMRKLEMEE